MNEATRWRLALATRIAASYARDPNAEVVMIAGSVGRGTADRYSDIEIDVYYAEPPTVAARIAAVERSGGTLAGLAEDEDEWEEQMDFGGFHAASSTFLVTTMERYLTEVVDQGRIEPAAQTRLFSLQHALPIKGDAIITRWRAKAAQYPTALVHAMLREHLDFERFWYAAEMFAARDDRLILYDLFVRTEQQIIGALLGLNRMYLPTPHFLKWMDETIAALRIKPDDLSRRLKQAFGSDPLRAVHDLDALIDETCSLVATHAPAFDLAPYRADRVARRTWQDALPNGLSLGD